MQALIDICRAATRDHDPRTLSEVGQLMRALHGAAQQIQVSPNDVPYGRYLMHAEAGFNIQLDVFSRGYTGGVHRHGTWGIFFVLKGTLIAEDWVEADGSFHVIRESVVGTGGAACFLHPEDWHRVSTLPDGPQTTSIHIYGRAFDLDTGIGLDANLQPRTYTRSAFGDDSFIQGHLT